MCSGWRMPGTPGRGDHDRGRAGVVGPVGHAGVQQGDRGVGALLLQRQEDRHRAAEREATAEHRHVPTGHRDLVVPEQSHDPGRRARPWTGHAEGEAAHVHRVGAVGVLVRIDLGQRRVVVDVGRRGVLEEHGVDRGIVVERPDRLHHVGLRGVARELGVAAAEPELLGLLHLHADVAGRSAVLAHQDRAEARVVPGGPERLDPGPEVGEDRVGHRLPGHHHSGHDPSSLEGGETSLR